MLSEAFGSKGPTSKQIVFLLMAATMVAVVVFLCGLLVGRGVPLGSGLTAPSATVDILSVSDSTPPPPTLSSPRAQPSAAAGESAELTYYRRLNGGYSQTEVLLQPAAIESDISEGASVLAITIDERESETNLPKAPSDVTIPVTAVGNVDVETFVPSADLLTTTEPAQRGFLVQVVALSAHASAQAVAAQLSAKGYPAAVTVPEPDNPVALFRVQIGPYDTLADAERVMRRLEAEERLAPFVTR